MRAARYYGPKDIRIEETSEPAPTPGQIKIKIAWNGICGSDLHAYLAHLPLGPTATEPNSITGETLPVTMGHEFSGTICELGQGIDESKYKIGQNVVVEPLISCMQTETCGPCASGNRNICDNRNFIGIGGWGGGLAEYITVDEKYIHILPDTITLEVGACIEPLAVAWHAVKRSGFKEGDTALILGGGPIGLFILKVLRSISPTSTIILSEPALIRRNLASNHGATHTLSPSPDTAPAFVSVLQLTAGKGVNVAFDCAGIQSTIDAALLSVKPRGTVVVVAMWEKPPTVNLNVVLAREINLTGIIAYDQVHPEVIAALASGRITGIENLITKRIVLEDVVKEGIEALLTDKDNQVKIIVRV